MNKQQGPTVEPGELYPISWDRQKWKQIFFLNVHICVAASLCNAAEINTTVNQPNLDFKKIKIEIFFK